jgi:glycosyltransferase involved in cell wall biosynthesis
VKLLIQIPCFNEEATLPETIRALPRRLEGIDEVEILVVDDGSTDRTVEAARAAGADRVVRLPSHQGLARAFLAGIEASLAAGADLIVNTDGDNQYLGADVARLVAPILEGKAEIVVGARPIDQIRHFSAAKRLLEKLGSWAVRVVSGTDIADAPSGFRAFSRRAALQLSVFSDYTYTLETIIQAGLKNIPILSVPIRTNDFRRPSRLVRSIPSYVWRSVLTIARIFMVYRPLQFFCLLAAPPLAAGAALVLRWLYLFLFVDPTRSRAPSLIAAAILLVLGFQLIAVGLVADLAGVNRQLLEEIRLRLREQQFGGVQPGEQQPGGRYAASSAPTA